jgi:hypothetical protein
MIGRSSYRSGGYQPLNATRDEGQMTGIGIGAPHSGVTTSCLRALPCVRSSDFA